MDEDIVIAATILEALRRHIADNRTLQYKVRHWRHRAPTVGEIGDEGCLSVRYVSEDLPGVTMAADPENAGLSMAEELIELSADLVGSVHLPPEDSEEDPTGIETPKRILNDAMRTLFKTGEQPTSLGGLLHAIRWEGTAPTDELEQPDEGELAERLVLVYRVRQENPLALLSGG